MNNEALLTISDIQKRLGIGRNQAYKLILTGDIPAFKIGHCWKLTEDALNKYIAAKENRRALL